MFILMGSFHLKLVLLTNLKIRSLGIKDLVLLYILLYEAHNKSEYKFCITFGLKDYISLLGLP